MRARHEVRVRADRSRFASAIAGALMIILMTSRLAAVAASLSPGQPAPQFTARDSSGHAVSLADYRGSIVVLEWSNHECPFVRRHYESGNMQALQKQAKENGVVWLTIISSAPGEQGYVTGEQADALTAARGGSPTALILDATGAVGHAYGAKTTPHMFVIDPGGNLVYMGAIDDQPRNFGADPANANNYVRAALRAASSGEPMDPAVTQSYGCTVKYTN